MEKNQIFPEGDYVIVRDAIEILLNKGCVETKVFLGQRRNKSSLLSAASSFVDFLSSLVTLDEHDINGAICSLKETQRFCESQRNCLKQKKSEEDPLGFLMNEILSTDAELYMAVLTILKQGIKDYIKGALMIRKAWKQYKKSYDKVVKIGGGFLNFNLSTHNHKTPCRTEQCSKDHTSANVSELCENFTLTDDCQKASGHHSIALTELQAAIAFGYGLFNLVVSLTPPKVLQVVQFFGFTGNQELGLACLNYVCHSQDVRAELSRPIYSFDESDVHSGLCEATQLLQGLEPKLLLSPVALYFEGLLFRCKGNFSDATRTLKLALERPMSHREILMFCDYEIGWCHLLEMKWDLAIDAFKRVKDVAVWSQSFYVYLIGITLGLQGSTDEALVYLKYVPSLVKRKSPLGIFLVRKANCHNKSLPQQHECLLLLLEIVYLWECLPTCSIETLSCFLNGLDQPVKDEFVPLKLFLTGYIMQRLGQLTRSIEYFKEAASKADHVISDTHVKPFALYELGLISVKISQFNKGLEFLKKAKEISGGYDFENRLKLKVDIAMKKVEEKLKEFQSSGISK